MNAFAVALAVWLVGGGPLRAETPQHEQPRRLPTTPCELVSPAASEVTPWRLNESSHKSSSHKSSSHGSSSHESSSAGPASNEEPLISTAFSSRSLEERLNALEHSHARLRHEHAELKAQRKNVAQLGHGDATLRINGRVHADLWGFPGDSPGVNGFETGDPDLSPQDRLGFRRIRLGAYGELPANMLYKVEMEFAGANDTEFRDVYLGWERLPFLQQLLVGNQKRPYGLDHLNSSNLNVFIERPFVVEGFNQDARRFGVCAYGVSEDQAWNWRYGAFDQRLIQDEGNYIGDHWQGQVAGRLANTAWWDDRSNGRRYAHWAVSGAWADTDADADAADDQPISESGVSEASFRTRPEARTVSRWLDTGVINGGDDYALVGLEGVVNVGPVQVVGEYLNVWQSRVGGDDLRFHGGYVYLAYTLTGEHLPWNRETGCIGRLEPFENFFLVDRGRGACRGLYHRGMGAWQAVLRFSYADFSDSDVQGGVGESVTAGLNWYWTPHASWQFNYLYGDITDNDLNAAVGGPNFGDYHLLGARFRIDF